MNKDEILSGIYNYFITNIPEAAINLISANDIRVENFFAIHVGVYLDKLLNDGHINAYAFQHTILLNNPERVHIDIIFTDSNNLQSYLEIKHFSITRNRGKGRSLSFYTSNSREGKKIGIVGDCEKLDWLRNNNYINNDINLICCAFITNKPNQEAINKMTSSFSAYDELAEWKIVYPIPLDKQINKIGMITLQKNANL